MMTCAPAHGHYRYGDGLVHYGGINGGRGHGHFPWGSPYATGNYQISPSKMTKSTTLLIALVILLALLVFMPDPAEASYCYERCSKHGYWHGVQKYAYCICYHKMKRDTTSAAATAAKV
ncbi:unnamed protein product [Adineta steineri]|uniref:Uncharacterized protein n=1 Tax=Adineta steineri TaxID=433720 RepID=A0A814GE61_9BILA|nr:unnamed protein product [Adineta steineri]CAF1113654.1 unnamed protein product [Adineta steineri]